MPAVQCGRQQFYQSQAAEQPGPGGATEETGEPAGAGARSSAQDDVVEADYEIVDDKK